MSFGQTLGSANHGIKRVFATALDETNAKDMEGAGAIRREGNATYKWIQYFGGAGSVAAVVGDVAYYTKSGTAATENGGHKDSKVTSDLSDSDELGAGVLQAVIPEAGFGWIQIEGFATLTTALTAGADGDPLTPTGSTDGTLDVVAAVTSHICAYAHDASVKEIICAFPK